MSAADTPLTASERAELEAKLRVRRDELRGEIAAQLKNQDDPRLVGASLAPRVVAFVRERL